MVQHACKPAARRGPAAGASPRVAQRRLPARGGRAHQGGAHVRANVRRPHHKLAVLHPDVLQRVCKHRGCQHRRGRLGAQAPAQREAGRAPNRGTCALCTACAPPAPSSLHAQLSLHTQTKQPAPPPIQPPKLRSPPTIDDHHGWLGGPQRCVTERVQAPALARVAAALGGMAGVTPAALAACGCPHGSRRAHAGTACVAAGGGAASEAEEAG